MLSAKTTRPKKNKLFCQNFCEVFRCFCKVSGGLEANGPQNQLPRQILLQIDLSLGLCDIKRWHKGVFRATSGWLSTGLATYRIKDRPLPLPLPLSLPLSLPLPLPYLYLYLCKGKGTVKGKGKGKGNVRRAWVSNDVDVNVDVDVDVN